MRTTRGSVQRAIRPTPANQMNINNRRNNGKRNNNNNGLNWINSLLSVTPTQIENNLTRASSNNTTKKFEYKNATHDLKK